MKVVIICVCVLFNNGLDFTGDPAIAGPQETASLLTASKVTSALELSCTLPRPWARKVFHITTVFLSTWTGGVQVQCCKVDVTKDSPGESCWAGVEQLSRERCSCIYFSWTTICIHNVIHHSPWIIIRSCVCMYVCTVCVCVIGRTL